MAEIQSVATIGIQESDAVDDAFLHSFIRMASAWDYLYRGVHGPAKAVSLDLKQRGQSMGDPRAISTSLWIDGWIHLFDEQYDEALEKGSQCERMAIAEFDRQIGIQTAAVAQVFRGTPSEGLSMLLKHRSDCEDRGFVYGQTGGDAPIAVAMVLCGDFGGGVNYINGAIARSEALGDAHVADIQRVYAAEIFLEILAAKERPPLKVLLSNLVFLVRFRLNGWKQTHELLLRAQSNRHFDEKSHWRARIETDLGLLYAVGKRKSEARTILTRARALATELQAPSLVRNIDAALSLG